MGVRGPQESKVYPDGCQSQPEIPDTVTGMRGQVPAPPVSGRSQDHMDGVIFRATRQRVGAGPLTSTPMSHQRMRR